MRKQLQSPIMIHASCVSFGDSAVLITGASGVGKSALSLELMSRGADLVADDRTILELFEGGIRASCPEEIRGQIEARGIGVLAADFVQFASVRVVVDLDMTEMERLPQWHETTLLGQKLPLIHSLVHDHFPAAILQYLKGGRRA